MPKQIAKKDLSAADQRFDTQRARYLYLTKLGYSQAQIAAAYAVSKRAVWHLARVVKAKGGVSHIYWYPRFGRQGGR